MSELINENFEPLEDELKALEAFAASLDGDSDKALLELQKQQTPLSIDRQLAILFGAQKYEDARALIEKSPLNQTFCANAVAVYTKLGQIHKAKEVVNWAKMKCDLNTWHRCILKMAFILFDEETSKYPNVFFTEDILEDSRDVFTDIISLLSPIIDFVIAKNSVKNEIESLSLQIAIDTNRFLGEWQKPKEFAELLKTRTPIPLAYAKMVLGGSIEPGNDIPRRLRAEHPTDADAQFFAAIIDTRFFNNGEKAFEQLRKNISSFSSDEYKRKGCERLIEVAQYIDASYLAKAISITEDFLGKDDPLINLERAHAALCTNDLLELESLIDRFFIKDDSSWAQLKIFLFLKKEMLEEAYETLINYEGKFCLPNIYHNISEMAFKCKRLDIAKNSLQRLVSICPEDISAHHNLAAVQKELGEYDKAEKHLKWLCEKYPDKLEYSLDYANCLAINNKCNESLTVYKRIYSFPCDEVDIILGYSKLLSMTGNNTKAFEILDNHCENFWSNLHFLCAFLELSFDVGKEQSGYSALARLLELQDEGSIRKILQTEDPRKFISNESVREKSINKNIIQGRCPWLTADRLQRIPANLGWKYRTQPIMWIYDDPLIISKHSIYATNAFTSVSYSTENKFLEQITCPPQGSKIVIDLSAILTLFHLGLLEPIGKYYSEILFPYKYFAKEFLDRFELSKNKHSENEIYKAIESYLSNGKISVYDSTNKDHLDTYVVKEQIDNAMEHYCYGILDLLNSLVKNGRILQSVYDNFSAMNFRKNSSNEVYEIIPAKHPVLISLDVLCFLSKIEVISDVVDCYSVYILPEDRAKVQSFFIQKSFLESTKDEHEQLWKYMRTNSYYRPESYLVPNDMKHFENDETGLDVSFSSNFLACNKNLPLLVDDRVIQAYTLNNGKTSFDSFSTDILIQQMYVDKHLSLEETTDAYLKLIDWRYKFIIPPVDVLVELSVRYKNGFPGFALKKIARYVHLCMNDSGLFAGAENTTPPSSMAMKTFFAWNALVAEYTMNIWTDDRFNDQQSKHAISWAINNLLPSPPRTCAPNQQAMLCEPMKELFLTRVLFYNLNQHSPEKINEGIRHIASELPIDFDTYSRIIEAINES